MRDDLRDALSAVTAPIDTAATLPPAVYVDASVAELERDAVFRTSWVGVGRSDQWKAPGDYSALKIAGIPVIIVRD
jgi:phenylpropionate dioxygenase-like ring-hydroxylating dioxygenase large terminal subunit